MQHHSYKSSEEPDKGSIMPQQSIQEGRGISKGKTPEEHAEDRAKAKARRGKHRRKGGATVTETLFEGIARDRMQVSAVAREREARAKTVETVKAKVYADLKQAIVKVATVYNWDSAVTASAMRYAAALVHGGFTKPVTLEINNLERVVRRSVEQRFATGCWFNRRDLAEHTLPGMKREHFERDYESARERFPATPNRQEAQAS